MNYGPATTATRNLFGAAVSFAMVFAATVAASAQPSPNLDVIFVPTPMEVVERMLTLADVKKGEFLIDLGCGDGRIPVTAAKKYGARGLCVDLDPTRIKEANERVKNEGVGDSVEVRQQNLFDTDITKADVISMYLLPELNRRLRPRILDLRPGTRIVSHAFDMGEWKPDQEENVNGRRAYLWIVPAKVEGKWNVQSGDKKFDLDVKQSFQEVSGEAQIDGKSVPIQNGKLKGKEISFEVQLDGKTQSFRGEVDGGAIKGSGWQAKKS
jgi:SAM-dependent methyltransferase